MKISSILLSGVFCCTAAACTNSFEKVRDAADKAPDWYEDARVEIRGEGYPELTSVPELDKVKRRPSNSIRQSKVHANDVLRMFENEPRANAADKTPRELQKIVNEINAEFAGEIPPPDYLTPEEIAAIRAEFDIPYLTEGWFFKNAGR